MYRAGKLLAENELQAGDIIIFRPSEQASKAQRVIKTMQALYPHSGGHADSTHVAVCTGISPAGEPLIAHLSNTEDKKLGYVQESIMHWQAAQNDNLRSFVVFRPKDQELAAQVGAVAGDKKKYGMTKWKAYAGVDVFLRRSFFSHEKQYPEQPYQREVDPESVCSKFVIQLYKAVAAGKDPKLVKCFMNIASATSPAKLESYLYNNKDFDFYVAPGINLYETFKEKIKDYIVRLQEKSTPASILKAEKLINALSSTEQIINEGNADSLIQAKLLLANTLPIIKVNTGKTGKTPSFYTDITGTMKRRGIFQRDIDNFTLDQIPAVTANPLRMPR